MEHRCEEIGYYPWKGGVICKFDGSTHPSVSFPSVFVTAVVHGHIQPQIPFNMFLPINNFNSASNTFTSTSDHAVTFRFPSHQYRCQYVLSQGGNAGVLEVGGNPHTEYKQQGGG